MEHLVSHVLIWPRLWDVHPGKKWLHVQLKEQFVDGVALNGLVDYEENVGIIAI